MARKAKTEEVVKAEGPIRVTAGTPNPIPYQTYFHEMPLAHQWCQGSGIELGAAAHNSFGLPKCLNVAPFGPDEESDFELYKAGQIQLCGYYAEVDIAATADHMPEIKDDSLDYVLSSHVLEHLPNLIEGLAECNRKLKVGGIFFAIVPLRDALPSDAGRTITPFSHFVEDYEQGVTVDNHIDPEGLTQPRRGHYHVFTPDSFDEVVQWCNQNLSGFGWEQVARENQDSKVGNGFTLVYRKLKPSPQSAPTPTPNSSNRVPDGESTPTEAGE